MIIIAYFVRAALRLRRKSYFLQANECKMEVKRCVYISEYIIPAANIGTRRRQRRIPREKYMTSAYDPEKLRKSSSVVCRESTARARTRDHVLSRVRFYY